MKPKHAFGWMIAGLTMLAGQQLLEVLYDGAKASVCADPVIAARQVVKFEPIGLSNPSDVQHAERGPFNLKLLTADYTLASKATGAVR